MVALQNRPGSWGFAPPALVDEPLDGYFEYVAHRLQIPPSRLSAHLGIRATSPFGPARGLHESETATVAEAFDLTCEQVSDMTLRRYTDIGLLPPPGNVGGGPGPWLRRSGARFCPACLRERGVRWRLSWYLQWTFVCTTHGVLLDSACPSCLRAPRTRRGGHPVSGPSPTPGQDCVCPASLLAEADRARPDDQKVLDVSVPPALAQAQRLIHEHIHGRGPVQHLGLERSRSEWLHDLAALTRLLVVNLPTERIPEGYFPVLASGTCRMGQAETTEDVVRVAAGMWQPHLGLSHFVSPPARFSEAGASRVTFAVAAATAAHVLAAPDMAQAAEMLRVLPSTAREEAASRARSRGISWPLNQALWLLEHSPRSPRVRAIRLGSDRFRIDGSLRVPLDRSRIPARPWREVRREHPWTGDSPFTGLAATVALLTTATTLTVANACGRLGHDHLATRVSQESKWMFAGIAQAVGGDLFDDLLLLHDAVTIGEIPIDYERRRRVFRAPVALAGRTARKTAHDLGVRNTPRLARFMSWWIYEQLTGNDALLRAEYLQLPGVIRATYGRQRETWDATPPQRLLRRAEHALMVNRIDEPISWCPVVTDDGAWVCPPSDIVRQLDWSRRLGRATARLSTTKAEGLDADDVVALAGSGQSDQCRRLATMLARFHVVARTGTISHAANQIGIAQPTLSVGMRSLESDLDRPLFDRSHHMVTLTPQGRDLYRALQRRPLFNVDPARDLRPGARDK